MYITAQAVTNEQGRTISGGIDYAGLKTVDLTSKRLSIWKPVVNEWTHLTIQQMLQGELNNRYHSLAFYLSAKRSVDTLCKVGIRGAMSIIIDDTEYRMRSSVVHERKVSE